MSLADPVVERSDADIERAVRRLGGVASWADDMAHQHGLTSEPEPIDTFVDAVSRLSGAEVRLDTTERLLVAIERVGLVTGRQGVLLHAAYLRQKPDRDPSSVSAAVH